MNKPSDRSDCAPPCIRPNSTVPNTTSCRPVVRDSTSPHATCIMLAALTPSRRACPRSAPDSSGFNLRAASAISRPSP
ncbi:putative non-ribosomal peptide synthetase [Burkholderia pseudomallei]|nr:putative non-ribosomal peptide synthetase [Burkholderia pseudomallei]